MNYLRAYAKHFHIEDRIQLRSKVTKVSRKESGGHVVSYVRQKEDGMGGWQWGTGEHNSSSFHMNSIRSTNILAHQSLFMSKHLILPYAPAFMSSLHPRQFQGYNTFSHANQRRTLIRSQRYITRPSTRAVLNCRVGVS